MKHTKHRIRRPFADALLLSAAALLLIFYLAAETVDRLQNGTQAQSPLLRCLLLICICIISYLGGILRARRVGSSRILRQLIVFWFVLYLYLLLSLTLFDQGLRLSSDRLTENGMTAREYYLRWFVNLRPFESIYTVYIRGLINGYVSMRYTLLNLLGNLCAFMPFAYFLPTLWRPMKKWYLFLPAMLLTVAAVEGLQFLLMVGSCDIDDLILNAGGAFALFWILRIPLLQRAIRHLEAGGRKSVDNV